MIDLALYRDVLGRHRMLVTIGVGMTLVLALSSLVTVSPSGISYRTPQIWSNEATLVLSQKGFSEGRSVLPESAPPPEQRFSTLVELYAALATSDAVMAVLKDQGLITQEDLDAGTLPVTAAPVPTAVGAASPVMKITGSGTSPAEATRLTRGATDAFVKFLRARQIGAGIPEAERIQLRVVKRSGEPTITKPRSKTLLVLILLAGLTITGAAAFIRDNAQRRPQEERAGPVSGSGPPISQRPGSGGLSLAAASSRPFEAAGPEAIRPGDRNHALARLEEVWPMLRAESIGLVHIRCNRDGAERGIDSIACYAILPQDGGFASIAPSHDLVSELDEVAFALLLSEVGAMRNGDVSTLVLDLGQKTATLHEGWIGTHDAHGRSGSRRSLLGGSA